MPASGRPAAHTEFVLHSPRGQTHFSPEFAGRCSLTQRLQADRSDSVAQNIFFLVRHIPLGLLQRSVPWPGIIQKFLQGCLLLFFPSPPAFIYLFICVAKYQQNVSLVFISSRLTGAWTANAKLTFSFTAAA